MEVKFNNPFAIKKQALKDAAAVTCKGCDASLPDMTYIKMVAGKPVVVGEDTIRTWCSRPKRTECRKLYHRSRRNAHHTNS